MNQSEEAEEHCPNGHQNLQSSLTNGFHRKHHKVSEPSGVNMGNLLEHIFTEDMAARSIIALLIISFMLLSRQLGGMCLPLSKLVHVGNFLNCNPTQTEEYHNLIYGSIFIAYRAS